MKQRKLERFSYNLENGFGKCSLFVLLANGWKDQNMASSFSRQENPNIEKALFNWPIVFQYDVKVKYRLISSYSERSLKATRVCIRSTNQSNRSIPVCFFFLFCSRVFILRSYKNRSTRYNMWPLWLFTSRASSYLQHGGFVPLGWYAARAS